MRERVPALSLRPRPPYRVASWSAAHSGAATDRAAADMVSGDPSKDLRRALAANRAMRERCGRIEAERDSARSELQAAEDQLDQVRLYLPPDRAHRRGDGRRGTEHDGWNVV